MRELTKSMMSCTWAMSVFGMQQLTNLFTRRESKGFCDSADSFNRVTSATVDQLGGALKATFRAGDQFQRGLMDLMFSASMMGAWSPERCMPGEPGLGSQPGPGTGPGAAAPGTFAGPPPGTYPGAAGTPPAAPGPGNGRAAASAGPRGSASWSWGTPKTAAPQRPTTAPSRTDTKQGWGPMP